MGQIDILINNAALIEYHPIAEIGYQQWQKAWYNTISVNLLAVSNLCFCAAKAMKKMEEDVL